MWAKAINPQMYINAEACASDTLNHVLPEYIGKTY